MSVRRILLAKCLVVVMFCVTGSSLKVYKVLNDTAFLSISNYTVQKTHEIKWEKGNSLLMKLKQENVKNYTSKGTYTLFINGTLQIHSLVKDDSGNYRVQVYDSKGKWVKEDNFTLTVLDPVYKPKITWVCSKKSVKVICKAHETDNAFISLAKNNVRVQLPQLKENGTLKAEKEYKINNFHEKFQCEVKNDADKKTDEQEIICSGSLDIVLIVSIAGGAVFFVIFLALLIYCIRKKRAERYEDEEEDRPMQSQKMSDELKYRDLPEVPAHAPQRQPRQQQRPAPQQPHTPHQTRLPQPRPRMQPKSPSHMRERQ